MESDIIVSYMGNCVSARIPRQCRGYYLFIKCNIDVIDKNINLFICHCSALLLWSFTLAAIRICSRFSLHSMMMIFLPFSGVGGSTF
jgi:hypothetical protein